MTAESQIISQSEINEVNERIKQMRINQAEYRKAKSDYRALRRKLLAHGYNQQDLPIHP